LKIFLKKLQVASWKQAQNKGIVDPETTITLIQEWTFVQPKV